MTTPVSTVIPINVVKKQIACTVLDYRGSEKPEPTTKTLTLLVERCSTSSEAICVQLTQESDLTFLYRDEITQAKFKTLANDWRLSKDLRDDMKDFFQGSLREMVNDSRMEAKAILPKTEDVCILEIETPEGRSTLKITIELKSVSGDEHTNYLMDSIRNLKKRNKKLEEDSREKKRLAEQNFDLNAKMQNIHDKCTQLELEINKKDKRLEALEKQLDEKTIDLQLAEENVEEDANTIQELRGKLIDAERELDECMCDIDVWKREYDILNVQFHNTTTSQREEIDRLEVSLKKYDEILKKYHSTPISISEGKLRELEESNKEKDSVIEDLKKENAQLMRTTDELLSRNSELSRKLDKNTADLEKFKRAYLALQLNINSNNQQMFSPQLAQLSPTVRSPYFQNMSPGAYMPPQVGIGSQQNNRFHTPIANYNNYPTERNSSPRLPTVPVSVTDTPVLEQQKKKLLQAAQAAKGSENVPPLQLQ